MIDPLAGTAIRTKVSYRFHFGGGPQGSEMKALSFSCRFGWSRLAWVLIRFEMLEEVRTTSSTLFLEPLVLEVEDIATVYE